MVRRMLQRTCQPNDPIDLTMRCKTGSTCHINRQWRSNLARDANGTLNDDQMIIDILRIASSGSRSRIPIISQLLPNPVKEKYRKICHGWN